MQDVVAAPAASWTPSGSARSPDYAMVIRGTGGPEVLERIPVEVPSPGPGEVLLAQSAVGLNFVDIYHRSGQFGEHDALSFPMTLGVQGAGRVEALGDGVSAFAVGDRVAYVGTPGAYVSRRAIAASRLVKLPDDVSDELAAATLVRGLTAEYLLFRIYRVSSGDTVVIHAAAGGVGSIAAQWAKSLGATVIGTVGSEAKRQPALRAGCDHVVLYTEADWAAQVLDLTGGQGVPVVYDSVGRATFLDSLKCLRDRGLAINYGTTSGQVEDFPLQLLHKRSLSVCRPTLPSFTADPAEYAESSARFFRALRQGVIEPVLGPRYSLSEAARAHSDFEGRRIDGMPVLVP